MEQFAVVNAVLQSQYDSIGADQRRNGVNGGGVVIHLDGEQYQLLMPQLRRNVGSAAVNGKIPVVAAGHAQPAAPDSVQMGAPCDKSNLVAGARQQAAKVSAHAAGAHNCDSHS